MRLASPAQALAFLRELFSRWKALGVSHNLTVVLFGRSYFDGDGCEGGLMRDGVGRRCSDFYKLVLENESRADWGGLLETLQRVRDALRELRMTELRMTDLKMTERELLIEARAHRRELLI